MKVVPIFSNTTTFFHLKTCNFQTNGSADFGVSYCLEDTFVKELVSVVGTIDNRVKIVRARIVKAFNKRHTRMFND